MKKREPRWLSMLARPRSQKQIDRGLLLLKREVDAKRISKPRGKLYGRLAGLMRRFLVIQGLERRAKRRAK